MCTCGKGRTGLAGLLPYKPIISVSSTAPIAAETNPFANPFQTPTNPSASEVAVKNTDRATRIGNILTTIGTVLGTVGGAVLAKNGSGQPTVPGSVILQPTIDENGSVVPTDPTAILQMQCAQRMQEYDPSTGTCQPIGNTKPDFARMALIGGGVFLIYTLARK